MDLIRRYQASLAGVGFLGLLLACGNGQEPKPGAGSTLQSPADLSYATPKAVYTLGAAIAPNTPTNPQGSDTIYSVNPKLPAGLVLDSSTGAITGTPTAAMGPGSYTVKASSPKGDSQSTLSITVKKPPPPPDQGYPAPSY